MSKSVTQELFDLKSLLDSGAITTEEFNILKKQIIDKTQQVNDELFKISLVSINEKKKIETIAIIREITGLGLADAKYFVEHLPNIIQKGLPYNICTTIQNKLTLVDAGVEIQTDSESDKVNDAMANFQFESDKQPRCPKCGSVSITTGARGVNWKFGLIGASKTVNRCANCGNMWSPK